MTYQLLNILSSVRFVSLQDEQELALLPPCIPRTRNHSRGSMSVCRFPRAKYCIISVFRSRYLLVFMFRSISEFAVAQSKCDNHLTHRAGDWSVLALHQLWRLFLYINPVGYSEEFQCMPSTE